MTTNTLSFRSHIHKTQKFSPPKQMVVKFKWCKQSLLWNQDDWKKVLFKDESPFIKWFVCPMESMYICLET